MTEVLSGDRIRAGFVGRTGGGLGGQVVRLLTKRGAMTTRDVAHVLGGNAKRRELNDVLASLVDDGKIIGTRKPTTARGGRPGIVWQVA